MTFVVDAISQWTATWNNKISEQIVLHCVYKTISIYTTNFV